MEIVRAFNNNNFNREIIIKGTHNNPLFRASDIGDILGFVNVRQSISDYNDLEKVVIPCDTLGGVQNVSFLTIRGLYKLLLTSKKPIAEKFQNWVYEVVEEIRLTGEYKLKQQIEETENKLRQAEETIQRLEHENDHLNK
jgi:prophage antirepressor-like protein